MTFGTYSGTLTTSDSTLITATAKTLFTSIVVVNASGSEAIIEYIKVVNTSNTLKYYIVYNQTLTASGGGIESSQKYGLEATDKLICKLSSGSGVTIGITTYEE